jgi:hypothetical protein
LEITGQNLHFKALNWTKRPSTQKAKGWIPKKEEQEKDDSPGPLYYLVETLLRGLVFVSN